MVPLLSAKEMQAADAAAISGGIPQSKLMENAARALVAVLEKQFGSALPRKKGLILAGPGNNGGDAIVAVKLLGDKGIRTTLVKLGEKAPEKFGDFDWILDGLFGIGLSRPIDDSAGFLIDKVNSSGAWVLSADIPSGLNADTGVPMGKAVKASATVTFGFYKKGLFTGQAADYVGTITLDEIGIPRDCAPASTVFLFDHVAARMLPKRRPSGHKGSFGHVFVRGGEKRGAAELAVLAALRSGAGLATLLAEKPDSYSVPSEALRETYAESFYQNPSKGVLVLGPGFGLSDHHRAELKLALQSSIPTVLDGDALTLLAERGVDGPIAIYDRESPTILTPHPKEAARLLGETVEQVEADRFAAMERLKKKYSCAVLLKGKGSLISAPGVPVLVVTNGNTILSKGGSGDLLSGLIGSFLAQGLRDIEATALGAYVHGRSAEKLAAKGMSEYVGQPSDIVAVFAEVFKELESE